MAADKNNDDAEDHSFDQTHGHVAPAGEVEHVVQIVGLGNAEHLRGKQVSGENSHADALGDEQGHGDKHGEEPRDNQVIDRMNGEGAERVELLGDLHRSDLGRHGRADASGHHESAEHGAEFPEHRDADHGTDGGVHLQPVELEISLRGEDRAGERAGDEHDELGAEADFVDLLDDEARTDLSVENAAHRFGGEQTEVAEVSGKGEDQFPDVTGRSHGCSGYGRIGWVAEGELATLWVWPTNKARRSSLLKMLRISSSESAGSSDSR